MKNATYLKLVASASMLTMGSYAFAQSDNNGNVAGVGLGDRERRQHGVGHDDEHR